MSFPHIDAEAEYYNDLNLSEVGIIEALDGTLADIRINSDNRLEEACELETGGYHPLRGYRQPNP